MREDQVKHQEKDRRPQEIYECPLYEAEASEISDLLELELEDLVCCRVEPDYLLLRQTQTLYKLDIAERFGRRSSECGGLGDDHLLDRLDAPAQQ